MKNVLTTLKIKIVVFSLVFSTFLIPYFVFADSSEDISSDLSSKGLSDDFIMASTLQVNALQATTYTTTDIYNLLYHCLREGANSAFGSIVDIHNDLNYYANGENFSLAEVSTLSYFAIDNFYDTYFTQGLPMIADIDSKLSTTNSKLEYVFSAIEDTINIKWYSPNYSFIGVSKTLNGEIITSNYQSSTDFYVKFNISNNYDKFPNIFRIFVPLYPTNYNISGKPNLDIDIYANSNKVIGDYDYFIENTNSGIYIYLIGFSERLNTDYSFHVHSDSTLYYNNSNNGNIFYIPFDTLDYQIIKNAFYQAKSSEGNNALTKLADVYASDDLIQAKANQQAYEDEVISEFTGNGASASKTSDKNGLKSVSGNIKSGLDTGGSINNALSVFNTSNSLWQFFTTTTQNNVDIRSGSNNRSFNLRNSNDSILDFQTERDREYYSHLGE